MINRALLCKLKLYFSKKIPTGHTKAKLNLRITCHKNEHFRVFFVCFLYMELILSVLLLTRIQATLKKIESKNFFAFRRNEEMGGKIYIMQNEMEEMDRKHSLEVQIYKERLAALGMCVCFFFYDFIQSTQFR